MLRSGAGWPRSVRTWTPRWSCSQTGPSSTRPRSNASSPPGESSGAPIVAASYGGNRGHPLLVDRSAWADIPDEGLRSHEPLLVPCDDVGAPGDVDYPDDLPERFRPAPDEPM